MRFLKILLPIFFALFSFFLFGARPRFIYCQTLENSMAQMELGVTLKKGRFKSSVVAYGKDRLTNFLNDENEFEGTYINNLSFA